MIKILAYKYPTSADVLMQRNPEPVSISVSGEVVKETIGKLLFDDKFNYLLIGLNNKMFICESVDHKAKIYSRREIGYHPDENQIYEK